MSFDWSIKSCEDPVDSGVCFLSMALFRFVYLDDHSERKSIDAVEVDFLRGALLDSVWTMIKHINPEEVADQDGWVIGLALADLKE